MAGDLRFRRSGQGWRPRLTTTAAQSNRSLQEWARP